MAGVGTLCCDHRMCLPSVGHKSKQVDQRRSKGRARPVHRAALRSEMGMPSLRQAGWIFLLFRLFASTDSFFRISSGLR